MTNVNDFIYPIELSKSPDSIAKRNKQRVGPYLIQVKRIFAIRFATYQEELALLLIQASPPPTAYCFSQLKQGTYLIWLNGDKLGGIYAEKEQQLLIIKYEIIAFINA